MSSRSASFDDYHFIDGATGAGSRKHVFVEKPLFQNGCHNYDERCINLEELKRRQVLALIRCCEQRRLYQLAEGSDSSGALGEI